MIRSAQRNDWYDDQSSRGNLVACVELIFDQKLRHAALSQGQPSLSNFSFTMTAFNSAETVSRLRLCAHVGGLDFVQCDRFSCRVLQENVPQHASRERALSLLTAIANANMPLQAQKEKPQLEPLQKVVG